MGGIGLSFEDWEPWTENQERCLRLLLVLSSRGMSLMDLRPVMSLERLWRLSEFLDFGCVDVWCTSSEVTAVPIMLRWRPPSLGADLCRWMSAGMAGTAGISSSSVSQAPLARKLNRNEFLLELWLEADLRRLSRRLERFVLMSVVPALLVGRRRSLSSRGLCVAFLSLSACLRAGC